MPADCGTPNPGSLVCMLSGVGLFPAFGCCFFLFFVLLRVLGWWVGDWFTECDSADDIGHPAVCFIWCAACLFMGWPLLSHMGERVVSESHLWWMAPGRSGHSASLFSCHGNKAGGRTQVCPEGRIPLAFSQTCSGQRPLWGHQMLTAMISICLFTISQILLSFSERSLAEMAL